MIRPRPGGWRPLFNGKDFSGWKLRNPDAKKTWVVCDDVRLDPADPARLIPVGKGGAADAVMLCGDDGRGSDLMTVEDFDDYELHLEFNVPKGSNSGVYNRGLFEIQVFDSFGVPKLGFHDCGALYERAYPKENLSKPPGQWQSFDITLKGKRLSLVWNGQPVYRDIDIRRGETDRAAFERLMKAQREPAPRASGESPRGRGQVRRRFRRRGDAIRPRRPRSARPDPAPGRSRPRRLSQPADPPDQGTVRRRRRRSIGLAALPSND